MFGKSYNSSVTVIIAAGGSGARMGGVYKPLEKLNGKEVISYSLELFEKCPMVKKIVIAARPDKIDDLKRLCEHSGFSKVSDIISGGVERQDSVEQAFLAAFKVPEDLTRLVAIHDAARPLLTYDSMLEVFETALKYGGAALASRVRDTVKKTDLANVVCDQVDRTDLWLIQTPQVFDSDIYHTALGNAKKNGLKVTDDCALVTAAGFKVVLCENDPMNIKLTYLEDILLASAIISLRENRENNQEKSV